MKTNYTIFTLILSFVLLLGATALSYGQTTQVLSSDNFESGFGSWNDGGSSVDLRTESYILDMNGNAPGGGLVNYTCNGYLSTTFVSLRGNGGAGSTAQKTLTSSTYDFTNLDQVIISYDYFITSMDNPNEGYTLQISTNDGSNWTDVKKFRLGDGDFNNNDCGENNTQQKKHFLINSSDFSFTSTVRLRFFVDTDEGSTGGGDYLFVDNIDVKGYTTGNCSAAGTILMERYDGISGTSISDLTGNANYPNNPSSSAQLTSFEIPANVAENYGARVSGYICAPETGYYTFWMTSDDNGELNLSTDEDPANKTTIAYVTEWTPQNDWDDEPNQKSNPVLLIAGNSYYVEALMKEEGGGDHLAIGWAKPGEATNTPSQIIPGSVLSPAVSNYVEPTDLFFENFNESDGPNAQTFVGQDEVNNTNWTATENGSADKWRYKDNRWEAEEVYDESSLVTEQFNITNYENLEFSLYIDFDNDLDDSFGNTNSREWVKVFYTIDNNTEQYLTGYFGKGENGTYTYSLPETTFGSLMSLRVEVHHNSKNDKHKIDNIKLTGVINCDSVNNEITNATATAGDTQASLSWSNPNVACYSIDEVMVVAKAASAVTTAPTGNGSAYTANATFGSGTAFDGGYVVYKGTAETVSITGLTNGTTYHLTTFTREGTTWSSGVTVTVTPIESPYLFFEDFEDEADEAITGTDVNGIGWSATLNGHNANYFGVDTQNGNKLFRADDLEDDRTGIKWESNTINIAGKTDLELSAYLEFDDTDSNDYLRIKVLVDGFSTTTVASFDDDVDNQDGNKSWLLVDNSGDPITGNTLKIIIEFFHDSSEEYLVDNIRLTDGNYWLGNENDVFTNTEKWSYKEVPTSTSTAKIATGAHLKLSGDDYIVKNFTVNGELTIEKDASLTTTEDFKNTGTTILNSGHDEFSSLLVQGTATGSISYNRWVNNFEAGTNGNDVIASPVTGESWSSVMANNQSSIFNNGTYWSFTPYINGGTGWGNLFTSSTDTTIESGLGYRVASPAGNSQTVKFTGELVNGAVTVQLSRNQTRWNVVGNPYSTYIDLAKFIQVNQAQLDEGYVLVLGYSGVNNTDGWAYYNLATALASDIKIAPGQGFYLAAKNNNSTVVFNPSMKTVYGADDFLQDGARSAVLDMQKFRLNINNGNKARHAEFYFFNRDDVSDSFDLGYDALIKNDGDNFNLYSTSLDGTVNELAIQTSHLDNMEASIIPVGIEAQAGQQLTFSIDNLNIADNIIIWLEDRATGVWTELNSTSTYVINTTETISGTGRFYIHFDNRETLNIEEVETNQINIVSILGNKTIVVNGNLETNSILELYDINGRKVLTKNLDRYTTTHRIDAGHLPTAPYIVTIQNQLQKVSKQVIIN